MEKILYYLGNISMREKMVREAAKNAYGIIISYILYHFEASLKR